MNVNLIHIGQTFPDHAQYCLRQLRLFYSGNISFLVSENLHSLPIFNETQVNTYSLEDLSKDNDSLNRFRNSNLPKTWGDFWYVTYERLFYLEQFMKLYCPSDVVHIENDIMIYTDMEPLINTLSLVYPNSVAINPVGEKHAAIAFTFIHDHNKLTMLNNRLINFLNQDVCTMQNKVQENLVSEMVVLNYLRLQENTDNLIDILPLLPKGDLSRNLDYLDCIFDGASWGQYVGGTTDGIPGWTGSHHFVGREIQKGQYTVTWKTDHKNRKVPIVIGSCSPTKLANLHIHSKKLELYRS